MEAAFLKLAIVIAFTIPNPCQENRDLFFMKCLDESFRNLCDKLGDRREFWGCTAMVSQATLDQVSWLCETTPNINSSSEIKTEKPQ